MVPIEQKDHHWSRILEDIVTYTLLRTETPGQGPWQCAGLVMQHAE